MYQGCRRHYTRNAHSHYTLKRSEVATGPVLKVVQALPALDGGGVEQGTLEIARALVGAGHESIVVSQGGRLVAALQAEGSRHVDWRIGRKHPATLFQVAAFRRWLAAERVDILHARSRMPAWVAWLACSRMSDAVRPRFVTTVHGLYSVSPYSAVMTRGERVVVVSKTARRYVLDHYPRVDANKLVRIYRGVDGTRFNKRFEPDPDWLTRWHREYPALRGKRIVVLPGRLTRLKGHFDFIDVLARVRPGRRDVVGLAVGGVEPKHRAYQAALARRDPQLVFTGHRSDMPEIMAISTAVVSLSTRPESFGRTVLEALSLGTPVVGYDHGGVGEVLAAIYPQGRARPGDAVDAAGKLATVLDDPERARDAIGEHDFDVERMCAETLALYAQLARAKSPPIAVREATVP